jgi:hypothetical protein
LAGSGASLIAFCAFCAGLYAGLCAVGCSGSSTTPSPPAIDLDGVWAGNVTVLGMTARMTWTLTQTNTNVTGPALLGLSNGAVLLNGSLTGSLSASTLTFTIAVGPGGIPSQPSCTGQIGGTMTATTGAPSTLAGTPAVISSSCSPPFPAGAVTLTRQ